MTWFAPTEEEQQPTQPVRTIQRQPVSWMRRRLLDKIQYLNERPNIPEHQRLEFPKDELTISGYQMLYSALGEYEITIDTYAGSVDSNPIYSLIEQVATYVTHLEYLGLLKEADIVAGHPSAQPELFL